MLIYIDRIYNTPVRELVVAENLCWPFHMKVHYCDVDTLVLPDADAELVVFEKQNIDSAKHIANLCTDRFNEYMAKLRNMGAKYVIVDASISPIAARAFCTKIMQMADTAVVPTKDRMSWRTPK